jgi:hypothetical protein
MSALAAQSDLNAPDNTSEGNLPKRWAIIDNTRCLIKGGGFLNQEPYNEVIASELFSRLLSKHEFVPYHLYDDEGTPCSLCPNMLADDEEYIPALYVDRLLPYEQGEEPLDHYIRCCESLGVVDIEEQVSKMIVCDYILANFDRHYRNFGLIRNVDSLSFRCAPLFDTGSSLWCNQRVLREDTLMYEALPFIADPLLQLRRVKDCAWFLPRNLTGFIDFAVTTLQDGPLRNYGMRLITLEDALDERISTVIDICGGAKR